MKMAASVVASRNGRQSSAAKSEAARANGKKGGRPRKADHRIVSTHKKAVDHDGCFVSDGCNQRRVSNTPDSM